MPTPPPALLQQQYAHLQATGFDVILAQAAQNNNLPVEFVYAIASRETNCKNILGDVQADGAHGVGIIQIDIQHPIARAARDSGSWQTNPQPLIDFGTQLLATNLHQVRNVLPTLSDTAMLQVTAAGYNCGIGRAIQAQQQPAADPDIHTTGHDYGKDTIARMQFFASVIPPPAPLPAADQDAATPDPTTSDAPAPDAASPAPAQ